MFRKRANNSFLQVQTLINQKAIEAPGAKNLAPLQNQKKPSQLGKLIIFIRKKMTRKGENHSVKLQKYYFCTTINKGSMRAGKNSNPLQTSQCLFFSSPHKFQQV